MRMDENGLSPSKHHRRELRYESWIHPLPRLRSSSDSKNAGYGKQVDMFGSSAGLLPVKDEDGSWMMMDEVHFSWTRHDGRIWKEHVPKIRYPLVI